MARKAAAAARARTKLELTGEKLDEKETKDEIIEEEKVLKKDLVSPELQKEFDEILKPSRNIKKRSLAQIANLVNVSGKMPKIVPSNYKLSSKIVYRNKQAYVSTARTGNTFNAKPTVPQKQAKPNLVTTDLQKAAQNALNLVNSKNVVTEKVTFAGGVVEVEGKLAPKKATNKLDQVLEDLAKPKRNITTLEKTQHDWKRYKKEHKINEAEIQKGKSYVDNQFFLQRVDQRVFEQEKQNRNTLRDFRDAKANKKK
eukprot:augustus_masked-scaffold_9-processed-gene-0.49-mRNA-1 protein AED:1.00 eAED:1.00 QI:0/-1/0/0/-1/1/1/0/255